MMGYLLDINILLSLAWPNHPSHEVAHTWLDRNRNKIWATCLITELGFVRISSNPKFSPHAVSPQEAYELLGKMRRQRGYQFWGEMKGGLDAEVFRKAVENILSSNHVTDGCLVALARFNQGRLATFDSALKRIFQDDVELLSAQ